MNVGVIVLRRTQPDLERGFRVPFVPAFPIIGTLLCIYLMTKLARETWLRFGAWLRSGVLIYVFYGRTHSRCSSAARSPPRRTPSDYEAELARVRRAVVPLGVADLR